MKPEVKRVKVLPPHGVVDGNLHNISAAMSGSYLAELDAIKPVKGSFKKRLAALSTKISDGAKPGAIGAVSPGELHFAIKEFGEDVIQHALNSNLLAIR